MAHKNLERKVFTVCRNLKRRFIGFRGQILLFSPLCLFHCFSHYPHASYLHKNCISVAHRDSVVAPYDAPSIFRLPAEGNFDVRQTLQEEKSKERQRESEREKRGKRKEIKETKYIIWSKDNRLSCTKPLCCKYGQFFWQVKVVLMEPIPAFKSQGTTRTGCQFITGLIYRDKHMSHIHFWTI